MGFEAASRFATGTVETRLPYAKVVGFLFAQVKGTYIPNREPNFMPPWNPIQPTCHPDRKHKAHGLCNECYDRQYKRSETGRKNHLEHVRRTSLKKLYGITAEEYDAMLESQGNVCAICKKPQPTKRRLSVDHDHETGKVRGLLCTTCNLVLGYHETDWLEKAKAYLRRHSPSEPTNTSITVTAEAPYHPPHDPWDNFADRGYPR